jgi:predicted esterase
MSRIATSMLLALALGGAVARPALAEGGAWTGTWVTDEGALTLTQEGDEVTGTYGRGGEITATVSGSKLAGTYRVGNASGQVEFELQPDGHFAGKWIHANGNSGTWRGWKQDPDAESKPAAKFDGHWLTSIGTLRLEQKGAAVEGPWRHQGWSTFKGTAKGRRVSGTLDAPNWRGKAWIELSADGKRIYGLTDESPPAAVIGLKVEGFDKEPKLQAGQIAQGIAENGMLYFARPPDGWKPGTPVDAIVLLHGSNWTTKGMVWVTAKNWPDLAKAYMIVGIQGEQWSSWSEADDLRFNYTYVNWMGRSTYKGYPYTERESPKLVSDVVAQLSKKHAWKRVFVGGHSQGGFLTYLMHMHFPEQFAGSFPVSGGLVIQGEPDVFEDAALKALQRARPMAIVHGRQDTVVPFDTALYIRDRFDANGFPLVTLIEPELGHPYDFLPIGDAVRYLDVFTAAKPEPLVAYAKEAAKAGRWHEVGAALARARELKAEKAIAPAVAPWDAAAKDGAKRFLDLLGKGEPGDWVDEFYVWKRAFGLAPSAAATMAAYEKLRAVHDPKAETLLTEARKAFRSDDREGGRAKYEELVNACWASGHYPTVKRWLSEMR